MNSLTSSELWCVKLKIQQLMLCHGSLNASSTQLKGRDWRSQSIPQQPQYVSPAGHTAYNCDMKPTPGSGFSSSHSSWFEATAASSLLWENSERAPRDDVISAVLFLLSVFTPKELQILKIRNFNPKNSYVCWVTTHTSNTGTAYMTTEK